MISKADSFACTPTLFFASPRILFVVCTQSTFVANVLQGQDFSSILIYIKSPPVTCPTEADTDCRLNVGWTNAPSHHEGGCGRVLGKPLGFVQVRVDRLRAHRGRGAVRLR